MAKESNIVKILSRSIEKNNIKIEKYRRWIEQVEAENKIIEDEIDRFNGGG